MRRQNGFGLSQLMAWGVILGLLAVAAMKILPTILEYKTILSAVRSVAANTNPQTTVAQVKNSFTKQMDMDYVKGITADDLDIYKEDNKIIVSFAYDKVIQIFGPVNLLIKYSGTSKGSTE